MSDSGGRKKKQGPDVNLGSGLWAVFMGLLGLLTAFVIVAIRWNDESGVAALGAVASSIGAILSAYFGILYAQRAETGPSRPSTRKRRVK